MSESVHILTPQEAEQTLNSADGHTVHSSALQRGDAPLSTPLSPIKKKPCYICSNPFQAPTRRSLLRFIGALQVMKDTCKQDLDTQTDENVSKNEFADTFKQDLDTSTTDHVAENEASAKLTGALEESASPNLELCCPLKGGPRKRRVMTSHKKSVVSYDVQHSCHEVLVFAGLYHKKLRRSLRTRPPPCQTWRWASRWFTKSHQ